MACIVLTPFMNSPPRSADWLIDLVNASGPDAERCGEWVRLWLEKNRDLSQCPALITEINGLLRYYVLRVVPCGIEEMNLPEPELPHFHLSRNAWTEEWPEHTQGREVKVHFSTRGRLPLLARRFLDFLLSSEAASLQVCGRTGCGRYFLQTPKRRKYCSPECAHSDTARKSMASKREKDQNERVAKALKKIETFRSKWPSDWKQRVASAAGTQQNWVTRQVNLGTLRSPPGRRSGE